MLRKILMLIVILLVNSIFEIVSNHAIGKSEIPFQLPLKNPRIVVHKAERQLILFDGGKVIRTYRIALGPSPVGPKMMTGDWRTPEGEYYICVKNPQSAYYLSLGISYPNDQDAARALKSGRITKNQHDSIVRTIRKKAIPPWKTPLGGEIFIHGGGSFVDWTLGCIALDNPDMRELYSAISVGTPLTVFP